MLTELELERYSRQIKLFGEDVQRKLKRCRVLIAGVGGLGTVVAMNLAALGIGKLVLVDHDVVKRSNLNRQLLYSEDDIGKPKALVAARRLKELNPFIETIPVPTRIEEYNVSDLVKDVDIVIDALDNWRTRFVLNEACVRKNVPLIHGGVNGFYGQVLVVVPGRGPCLRCVYPSNPPEPSEVPVTSFVTSLVALIQVVECFKILTGVGKPTIGKMIFVNALEPSIEFVEVRKSPACPTCSRT